jgi:hypothetical protein
VKILSSEHCWRRAESLRMVLLATTDPAKAVRLRSIIAKYRALAERGKKEKAPRYANQRSRQQNRKR